ncbi:MarR family winged helix-turn-helix transcriptional regulator [Nakamurella aerolata]|uniref:MarR family transcriptional regulator n=1 Tax=Nakamurella aerolata TaxID=1656892 RepID=A0A849A9S9_9ACTN|nr:MarR family transcriptional regulator [Nakamurella aerolata]NNG36366.1 MarR family transcriptional regulator [Nakamurella aerolata]
MPNSVPPPGTDRNGPPVSRFLGPSDAVPTETAELIDQLAQLNMANERMRATLAKELGMSLHEFSALGYIDNAAGTATPKALAGNLYITTGSATALIDRMVDAGYVARAPHPTDRRSILLELTDEGRQLMERIIARYAEATQLALGQTSARQTKSIGNFVSRFTTALDSSTLAP